jgi:hypothetical protein
MERDGMTDIQKAWEYLQQTSVGYKNLKVKPPTDKNSQWYKALVELGIITPAPPPAGMGAALRAAYPPLSGLQVIDFGGQTLTSPYVLDGATKGGKHLRNVKSVGANPDGFKFAGGAHDIILERFLIDLATSQGVNLQRAPRRIRFVSGVIRNIGTGDKFDHCGYIGSGSSEILFAGVLMFGASGEGIQWYPGPSEGLMTHCTMGKGSGSQEELCVWGGEDDGGDPTGPSVVTVWNSIIDGDIQMAGTDKTLRLRGTCCVTGNIPSSVDTTGCTLIRESPGFDGQHKPTNPKLLASGDPGWTPALDAYGNQYARPTVGAVAA